MQIRLNETNAKRVKAFTEYLASEGAKVSAATIVNDAVGHFLANGFPDEEGYLAASPTTRKEP